jgi:hypothetical protein
MYRKVFIYLLLVNLFGNLAGQEVVTGLFTNVRIKEASEKNIKKKGIASTDTLELPFFDDFSGSSIFPDQKKWQDDYVFINNTYSSRQKTEGIATFDALDNTGRLYETASSAGFEADRLTSNPINLEYSSNENIYLSFFYEPGGLADLPEPNDSLVLQFYDPGEYEWYSVWSSPQIVADTFKPVIIQIDQPRYLHKGFQFRFINYASLPSSTGDPAMAGNCDQWNLDYVVLDKNRNNADTIPADVAFTLPVRSLLKTYESMPWNQFRQVFLSEMGSWILIHYLNNDQITRNVTRTFEIRDVYKDIEVASFSAGAVNIDPFTATDYKANLVYTFNTDNADSALFRIKCMLTTDVFDPGENDTITYYQKFGNYFAFDDGTAESGYGVNGLGSRNAMVAYRFTSYLPDTLRAVQICFNDSYQNANQRAFDLMVWDNNGGIPGNVIYTQEEMMVNQGEGINGFYTYILDTPQELEGDFYVGWKQRSETFLNAGFDLNTLHGGRQLYWLNGDWNVSQAKGSLMIRPVFGPALNTTGIVRIKNTSVHLTLWPDPATDLINIESGDPLLSTGHYTIHILDLQGRELIKVMSEKRIDVSSLTAGMYFLIIEIDGRPVGHSRFIKSH